MKPPKTIKMIARATAVSFFVIIAVFMLAGLSNAGFSQASQSVAAEGMAGSFVGKADNSSAVFINPAGLFQIERLELGVMYSNPFMGMQGVSLSKEYFVLGIPIKPGFVLGAGISMFDASGLLKEYEGILGISYKINSFMAVGGSASYLFHSYQVSGNSLAVIDPVFKNGNSKSALGFDLGVMFFPIKILNLGFSARHINKPDMGLDSKDIVPMELRGGGMLKLERFNLLADINMRTVEDANSKEEESILSLGGEWKVRGNKSQDKTSIILRAGINSSQFTGGFGLYFKNLCVDYAIALTQNLMEDNSGSHKIAITFKFGEKKEKQELKASKKDLRRKDEIIVVQKELKRDDGLETKKTDEFWWMQ